MMGKQSPPQRNLFYTGFNLDKRIRKDHPLRKIYDLIDFSFIYCEVKEKYGSNGNVSVPPPVILKLMLLLVMYNVRSERELMDTLPERLDWLWFLDYDLDSNIPDHSVLSKARSRWGVEVFQKFFERVVLQCVEAGLVDGSKIFVDSSLVDADASNNSIVDTHSLKRYLRRGYRELERRLSDADDRKTLGEVNNRYVSMTDPDASIVKQGRAKLCYKVHRSVDSSKEVITATEVTGGAVNEAHRLTHLMDTHKENAGITAEIVVGDSKYGTVENFLSCYDRGVRSHIPDLKRTQAGSGTRAGIFSDDCFTYDVDTDTYVCPDGKRLYPRSVKKKKQSLDYVASKEDCKSCNLKSHCTRSKTGRYVKRYFCQEELDRMRAISASSASKEDIKLRQSLMERSFAQSTRYGFSRARWRRLWRVRIQEYLTAAIQNVHVLIKYGYDPGNSIATVIREAKGNIHSLMQPILLKFDFSIDGICRTLLRNSIFSKLPAITC